jgi:hypothetical protein
MKPQAVLPFCWIVATTGVYNLPHVYTHTATPTYDLNIFKKGSFINDQSDNLWRAAFPPKADKEAAFARIWLIKRMQALQQRPPPTLQKAREQWAAAMEFRRKLGGRQNASLNGRGNGESS